MSRGSTVGSPAYVDGRKTSFQSSSGKMPGFPNVESSASSRPSSLRASTPSAGSVTPCASASATKICAQRHRAHREQAREHDRDRERREDGGHARAAFHARRATEGILLREVASADLSR